MALRRVLPALLCLAGACGDDTAPPAELLVRTDAATGSECPHGGSVVRAGLDRDGSGVLDPAEVTSASPLCRDATAPPAPVLTRTRAEAAGPSCALGGTAVLSGADRDGNGALDDGEVEHTDYVCIEPGPDAPPLATRLDAIPAGAIFPAGGIALRAGVDDDRDGVLDDDEIDHTDTQCGDTLQGDVTIASDADLALLGQVKAINGSLFVRGASLTELRLPPVRVLGPSLIIAGNPVLTAIDLRGPRTVDLRGNTTIDIRDNANLTSVRIELSYCSSKKVAIVDNDALAQLDVTCPDAARTEVTGNDALTAASIDVTGPDSDDGAVAIVTGNGALAELHLRYDYLAKLELRGPAVRTLDTERLRTTSLIIDAPLEALPPFASGTHVDLRNTRLREIELGIVENVSLTTNRELRTASFQGVYYTMLARENPELRSLRIQASGPDMTPRPSFQVALVDNPQLETAPWLDELYGLEELYIRGNPALASPSRMLVESDLVAVHIADMPGLRTLDVAGWLVSEVEVFDTGVETVRVDIASHANDRAFLQFVGNPALTRIDVFARVDDGTIRIDDNDALRDVALREVTGAGHLSIRDNAQLPACLARQLLEQIDSADERQSGNDDSATCP